MKKFISLLISSILIMQMCLIIPCFSVSAEETGANGPIVLLSEDYTTDTAGGDYANREALGWYAVPIDGTFPSISFDAGMKLTQSQAATNTGRVGSTIRRNFTVVEEGNDEYMKIRRINFKGIYDIELDMLIENGKSTNRKIAFNGGVASENSEIFRYSINKIFDESWATSANQGWGSQAMRIKTQLDFDNGTVQLSYKPSVDEDYVVSKYNGTDKLDGDVAPMTSGSDYLSSLDFGFSYNITKYLNVRTLKLNEVKRTADVTDEVVAKLNTGLLTGASDSNIVTKALSLPTAASLGVTDATIEWSSSNTNVISNEGKVVNVPENAVELVMTAKISNNTDNFTQYADFVVVVDPASFPKVLLDEDYTADAADSDYANREALGWYAVPIDGTFPSISFDAGMKLTQSQAATNTGRVGSIIRRNFTVVEEGNDEYMKIRRINFKGIYDIELDMLIENGKSTNRKIAFNGGVASENSEIFRYSFNKIFDDSWATSANQSWGSQAMRIKTQLDFDNGTVQLSYKPSADADYVVSAYNGADKLAGNVAPMTSGSDYLSSLDFGFSYNITKYLNVRTLKLTEVKRTADVTDEVVASLSTNDITANNNIITQKLNLPNNFEGATVTWSTNGSSYVSDKGFITDVPAQDTPVKLTAKITNDADGFTQYADFNLILSSDAVKTEAIDNVLVTANKISFTLLNITDSVINASNVPFVATAIYYNNSADEMREVAVVDWTEIAQKYPQIVTEGVKPGEAIDIELTFNENIGSSYKIFFWENANTIKPVSLYTSR